RSFGPLAARGCRLRSADFLSPQPDRRIHPAEGVTRHRGRLPRGGPCVADAGPAVPWPAALAAGRRSRGGGPGVRVLGIAGDELRGLVPTIRVAPDQARVPRARRSAGLYASTSRAGALGVMAGCLALVVLRLKGRTALISAAGAAGLVALALLAILISPLRELNGDPGPARIHLWSDALGMLIARPLTGWGEDSTGIALGRFLTGQWAGPYVTFDRVH